MAKKLTTKEFIDKSNLIHNFLYDYSLVDYKNSKLKVKIICKKHGIIEQTPARHLAGDGCIFCSGKYKLSNSEFTERAKKIHGNEYNYSDVIYINNSTKINIICNKHGLFTMRPNNHLNGQKCPSCSNKLKLTNATFTIKANQIHRK